MRSELARPAGSHLILPGPYLGEMKMFHTNTRRWPARQGGVEFSLIGFVFFSGVN